VVQVLKVNLKSLGDFEIIMIDHLLSEGDAEKIILVLDQGNSVWQEWEPEITLDRVAEVNGAADVLEEIGEA